MNPRGGGVVLDVGSLQNSETEGNPQNVCAWLLDTSTHKISWSLTWKAPSSRIRISKIHPDNIVDEDCDVVIPRNSEVVWPIHQPSTPSELIRELYSVLCCSKDTVLSLRLLYAALLALLRTNLLLLFSNTQYVPPPSLEMSAATTAACTNSDGQVTKTNRSDK